MATLHYTDEGRGFPIVWIHGFPLTSAVFEPQTRIAGFRHVRDVCAFISKVRDQKRA